MKKDQDTTNGGGGEGKRASSSEGFNAKFPLTLTEATDLSMQQATRKDEHFTRKIK